MLCLSSKMFYHNKNSAFILFILFVCRFEIYKCESREIEFVVNPNCTSDCEKPWLIYGRGENADSTVHYLWSCMRIPTFVIAYSLPESTLTVNWDDFQQGKEGSVFLNPLPSDTLAISLQTLILFNDVNDTGKLDNISEDQKKYVSLSEFDWILNKVINESSQESTVYFQTTFFNGEILPNDTRISINITAFGKDGRSSVLPHLITTPNSAHLDISLDNLILDLDQNKTENLNKYPGSSVNPISGFASPRWALDMIIVSDDTSELAEKRFEYTTVKSLDDEYSPGVFNLDSVATPQALQYSMQNNNGSYLQWRPVCYSTTKRDINLSTYPNVNTTFPPIDDTHLENAKESLINVLFSEGVKNLLGAQTTVAFGLSKDGFYTKYNYAEWTLAMGLGNVPKEGFSSMVIIVISVGVGLPMLFFIAGGVFLVLKKYKQRGEILINE